MMASCSRCSMEATAVMRFAYASAQIWIDDLDGVIEPGSGYRFCDQHASSMTPPVGWELEDRRSPMMSLFAVDVA